MRRQKEEKEEKREMLKISSLSYHATCNEAGTNLSKTSTFLKEKLPLLEICHFLHYKYFSQSHYNQLE